MHSCRDLGTAVIHFSGCQVASAADCSDRHRCYYGRATPLLLVLLLIES